jgi:ABC-type uncharacterized transport system substrate-binding protein
MNRRELIALLGSTAATWPVGARAQQQRVPVVGILSSTSSGAFVDFLRAFRQGLRDTGYVEGENVAFEYRSAENQIERLSELAAELVRRQVAVIASIGGPATASAAKSATKSIPIVFIVGEDPVRLGLVASLARPGGNVTGINFFVSELAAKRLELLRELVPGLARVTVLLNPAEVMISESNLRDVEIAVRSMGLRSQVLNASTSQQIDAAFATFVNERPDALFVGSGPFFTSRRVQIVHLATLHKVPATYGGRQYVEAGGLMSYGASLADAFRQAGVYTGRTLKGTKPTDLPVIQASRFELVINAQTARTLSLTVPATLLSTANEVIE